MENIQLFGPFNSGTNLVAKILIDFCKGGLCNDGSFHTWKHICDYEIMSSLATKHKKTLFICMYKPVVNWIYSMKKESYNIDWKEKMNLDVPIIFNHGPEFFGLTPTKKHYQNIVDLHKTYSDFYRKLVTEHENCIFLEYYKIIDPVTVRGYLYRKLSPFGITLISTGNIQKILNKPSKFHGNPVKNYRQAFSKKAKNERLIRAEHPEFESLLSKYHDKTLISYFEK